MNCSLCSEVAVARNPFVKDPDIDYEIDSDEEWEEVLYSCYSSGILIMMFATNILGYTG